MPVFKVWVMKTAEGPTGRVEVGLGGTHEIDCPGTSSRQERLALFARYRDEVDMLLQGELTGTPYQPPQRAVKVPAPPVPAPAASTPALPVSGAPVVGADGAKTFLAELQTRLDARKQA